MEDSELIEFHAVAGLSCIHCSGTTLKLDFKLYWTGVSIDTLICDYAALYAVGSNTLYVLTLVDHGQHYIFLMLSTLSAFSAVADRCNVALRKESALGV